MVSAKGDWYRLEASDVGRLGDSSSGHCGGRVRGEAGSLTLRRANAGSSLGSVEPTSAAQTSKGVGTFP